MFGRRVSLALVVAGLLIPATASSPAAAQVPVAKAPALPVFTGADISRPGRVDLTSFPPDGSVATYYERVGSRRVPLGTRVLRIDDQARLDQATAWRCDRLVRRFEVDAVAPGGTRYHGAYSVRTPSCRYRFALTTPRQVPRGRRVAVGIEDTWGLGGVSPRLCIAAPAAPARCRVAALRPGQVRRTIRFTPRRTGRWKVRLRLAGSRPLRRLRVGPPGTRVRSAPKPVVLSTGDSTIQGYDGYLEDTLGDSARVVGRVRPGTALFRPALQSWPEVARMQSSELRPAATVVSLGVNDGFPVRTKDGASVPCCGERWVDAYTRRVRGMMRSWTRYGGHVAWMTLPPTAVTVLVPRLAAVNTAILRASAGLPRVTVVRVDKLLSPDGRYTPTRVIGGRRVKLYLSDRLHLAPPGVALATRAVVASLRRNGGLPPRR